MTEKEVGNKEFFWSKEKLPIKINEAYKNAGKAIKDFEEQREKLIEQSHLAEKKGDDKMKQEFFDRALHCDIAINAIEYSIQQNFGLSNIKKDKK